MQPVMSSLQKLLREKLNIYSTVITLKTDLKKDLDLADWEMLYLLNAVEEAWHISIPATDTEKIVRIEHLLDVVKRQKNRRAA
jgi:acyl carrier protein